VKQINKTVDPHHMRLYYKTEEEVKDWYRKLKERIESLKKIEITLVRKDYTEAVRPVKAIPKN
jgi:hypothetical protein